MERYGRGKPLSRMGLGLDYLVVMGLVNIICVIIVYIWCGDVIERVIFFRRKLRLYCLIVPHK